MKNQGILDKAVDVAADAMWKQQGGGADQRARYTEQASAGLQASIAPLLAAAWDAGHESGFGIDEEDRVEHAEFHNPYRAGTK